MQPKVIHLSMCAAVSVSMSLQSILAKVLMEDEQTAQIRDLQKPLAKAPPGWDLGDSLLHVCERKYLR